MPTETGIETQLKEAAQLSEAVWAVLAERVGGEWLLRFDYRLSKSAQNELMNLLARQVIDTWLCGALSGGYARSTAIPHENDLNVKRFFAFPDVYAAGVPQGDHIDAGAPQGGDITVPDGRGIGRIATVRAG